MRTLARYWKLTAISAFSLSIAMALGILGLSVTNTMLILPPSAPSPDRLVTMYSRSKGPAVEQISYPDYQYVREHNHVFTDVAAAPNSIGIAVDFKFASREVKLTSRPVSENYFAVLGIRPFLGAFFSKGDDASSARKAVMSWECWKRLGSDPKIVGKVLAGYTILGVTPKDFTGAFFGVNGDLFSTLDDLDALKKREARHFVLIGRLKPGESRRQAQADLSTLAGQLSSAYPKEDKDRQIVAIRASLLPPDVISDAEWMAAILMTLIVLVLFIACANVANLLLAVAVGRRQEASIKLALGASRGRLVREFLKESTTLCIISGLFGYGIAIWVVARYSNLTIAVPMFGSFSLGLNLHLDATVLTLALVLTLIASLATGLAPALYASSPALAQVLTGELAVGGTRKRVLRNALVVSQIAIGTLVLVGVGLCQRNLYNLRHIDPGFSARNLVAVTVYLQAEDYSEASGKQFYGTLRNTLSGLSGVEAVSFAQGLPLFGSGAAPVKLPEQTKTHPIGRNIVDANYFATLGIPILAGRGFDSGDREGHPQVVVISHKMAEMFWPGKDPIGRTIMAGDPLRKFTVIGIAADGKYDDLNESTVPFMYWSLAQNYLGEITAIARTSGDPRLWVAPIRQALRGLGLKIMIEPVTLGDWIDLSLLMDRIVAGCVAVLSALGLLLAVIGLFGAISYSVSERKKELGIRVALGARPAQLLTMILRQTIIIAGTGVVIGILLGVAGTAIFRSQLYGVGAIEWAVLVPVSLGMLVLSLIVAYVSARPWLSVDPMEAVRHA